MSITRYQHWFPQQSRKIKPLSPPIFIFLLAMTVRLFWIVNIDTKPISDFLSYYQSAISMVSGKMYWAEEHIFPIGYPAFLAIIYFLSGILSGDYICEIDSGSKTNTSDHGQPRFGDALFLRNLYLPLEGYWNSGGNIYVNLSAEYLLYQRSLFPKT